MGREGRDYWEAQLSEYWDSGLTIQEYSELKELPYESTRRWIRVSQKTLKCIDSQPLHQNLWAKSGSGSSPSW